MALTEAGRTVLRRGGTTIRWSGLLIIAMLLAGCGSTKTSATYRAPFLPIELTIDTNGGIEIKAGKSFVTPIGVFSIGESVEKPKDSATVLVIVHSVKGRQVENRFTVAGRTALSACLDGSLYGEFREGLVRITALDASASTIKLVDPAAGSSGCTVRRSGGQGAAPRQLPRGNFAVGTISVGGRSYRVALADTPEKIAHGMSGWMRSDLVGIDGMLYLLDRPQVFDRTNGSNGFVFPHYTFDPEILFFDATLRLVVGTHARACPFDGPTCPPYFAFVTDAAGTVYPVPYQYVLEMLPGRLPPQIPAGTLISA